MFDQNQYTLELCPYCDTEVVIYSKGVTACPQCKKPVVPCSVCDTCPSICPYGCTGKYSDRFLRITKHITQQEINDYTVSQERHKRIGHRQGHHYGPKIK